MTNRGSLLFAALALIGSAAFAQTASTPQPSDQDIDLLADYVAGFTYVTKQPFYVYNWFDASNDPKAMRTSATDPVGLKGVQMMSEKYWASQTETGHQGDMYGTGFYAAVDPVATQSYAGMNGKWVLTQIHIPSGFRMLDLRRDGENSLPLSITDALSRMDCPASWTTQGGSFLKDALNPNAYLGHPQCAAAIKRIFQEKLKIDGFAYGYEGTHYKECDPQTEDQNSSLSSAWATAGPNSARNSAFVITDAGKFTSNDVRVFSPLTTDDVEDRARIESLFYKAAEENKTSAVMSFKSGANAYPTPMLVKQQYPQYSGWSIVNSNPLSWTGTNTTWSVTLCNSNAIVGMMGMGAMTGGMSAPAPSPSVAPSAFSCVVVQMNIPNTSANPSPSPSPSASVVGYPQVISAQNSPLTNFGMGKLHWGDLEGKKTDPNISAWIKNNLYGCLTDPYYKPIDPLQNSCTDPNSGVTNQVDPLSQITQKITTQVH